MRWIERWAGVEAAMDLDAVLMPAGVAILVWGALLALALYANERDEESGSRSLTVSDLKRFSSLSLVEKVFAVLVVSLVMAITAGVAASLAVMIR